MKALEKSGFNMKKRYGLRHDDRLWLCAEYLLTMRNDIKSGAFDNFMRKLTPLLTNLFELYLASIEKNVRDNGVDASGHWDRKNIPEDWLNILDSSFGYFKNEKELATINMLPLINAFGDTQAKALAAMLVRMEKRVRNTVAHEIVPFGRQEIEAALRSAGIPAICTPEALADRLKEFLEIILCDSDDVL
jgi:hypothetical protein